MELLGSVVDHLVRGISLLGRSPGNAKNNGARKRKHRVKKYKKRIPDFMKVLENARGSASSPGEVGIRSQLVDSFLKASHGDLASFGKLHLAALEKDPIFYGHLARWYLEKGAIRDHHELFAAHLLTSPFPEQRGHGTVLLQYLRPYQVARVVKYCKEVLSFPTRALRSAVKFYLRRREENPLWFDEHLIRRRDAMKYLYATLHIRPSERAEEVLFRENPPSDSRVAVAKKLSKLADAPDEQARLILTHRIHYTAAIGSIKHCTPGILYALASVMTPQQVINNLKFFERRGALNDPGTRQVIEGRLRDGVRESRVSDFKSLVALSALNADENLTKELLEMTQERIRNRGEITVPTALFVDKSGSMQQCIEIGKILATICSTIAAADLYVYAFDTNSFELKAEAKEFASWQKAFAPVRADGATSIGSPFSRLMDKEVEQIVVISDGEENSSPLFKESLARYEKKHERSVRVFFLKVSKSPVGRSASSPLEQAMRGKDFTVIRFDGDYYNLPNVIPLLCSGSSFELVEEVLSLPLYTREDLRHLPPGFNDETYEIL